MLYGNYTTISADWILGGIQKVSADIYIVANFLDSPNIGFSKRKCRNTRYRGLLHNLQFLLVGLYSERVTGM
jgi:hypothetical protein